MHAIEPYVSNVSDQTRSIERNEIDIKDLGNFHDLCLTSVNVSHFNSLPHKFACIRN